MTAFFDALRSRATVLFMFVGSIWAVSVLNFILPLHLEQFGVHPRSLFGLVGFVAAPWLHSNLGHLMANTLPLLMLGWLAMFPQKDHFLPAVVGSMLGSGAVAWLLGGAHTVHIGASGVVFGLGGFLVARGYYSRRLVDIAIALPVVTTYGVSLLIGIFPIFPGVSWQSHLGGAIGGILTAKLVAHLARETPVLAR